MYSVFYEKSFTLFLSLSALKQLLWEGFIDEFFQYLWILEQFTQILHFCQTLTERKLCAGCQELHNAPSIERFDTTALGKS